MIDLRSSLLGAALVVAVAAALPSVASAAEPDTYVYSGEYRNLFDGYGITCTNPTARYFYIPGENPEDDRYDGSFVYIFRTDLGTGLLQGTFSDDIPVDTWILEYDDKIPGIDGNVAVRMNIPFSNGTPNGKGSLKLTIVEDDGDRKDIDSGVYTLGYSAVTGLSTSNGRYLDKISVSMNDVIGIIRCIRGVMPELREVDDGNYAAIGVVSGDGDAIVEKASSKKVIGDPDEEICLTADQPAEFPGGLTELMRWLCANMRYPEEAVKKEIEGRVVVRFVVGKDGTVSNPTIVNSVDPMLDREALRVIRSMPKWIPGENDGEPVAVYYNLPITFRLR